MSKESHESHESQAESKKSELDSKNLDLVKMVKDRINANDKYGAETALKYGIYSKTGMRKWHNALNEVGLRNKLSVLIGLIQRVTFTRRAHTACITLPDYHIYMSPTFFLNSIEKWEDLLFLLLHEKTHGVLYLLHGRVRNFKSPTLRNHIEDIFVNHRTRRQIKPEFDLSTRYYSKLNPKAIKASKGLLYAVRGDYKLWRNFVNIELKDELERALQVEKMAGNDIISRCQDIEDWWLKTLGSIQQLKYIDYINLMSVWQHVHFKKDQAPLLGTPPTENETIPTTEEEADARKDAKEVNANNESDKESVNEEKQEAGSDEAEEPEGEPEDSEEENESSDETAESDDETALDETEVGPDALEDGEPDDDAGDGEEDTDKNIPNIQKPEEGESTEEESDESPDASEVSNASNALEADAENNDDQGSDDTEEASGELDESGAGDPIDNGEDEDSAPLEDLGISASSADDGLATDHQDEDGRSWKDWDDDVESPDEPDSESEVKLYDDREYLDEPISGKYGSEINTIIVPHNDPDNLTELEQQLIELAACSNEVSKSPFDFARSIVRTVEENLVGVLLASHHSTEVVMTTLMPQTSRRDLFALSVGSVPTMYHQYMTREQPKVKLYQDVSGSMSAYYVLIPKLAKMLAGHIDPKVGQFSTDIVEVDPYDPKLYSSGGTNYTVVAQDIINEGHTEVIIVTDNTEFLSLEMKHQLGAQLRRLVLITASTAYASVHPIHRGFDWLLTEEAKSMFPQLDVTEIQLPASDKPGF